METLILNCKECNSPLVILSFWDRKEEQRKLFIQCQQTKKECSKFGKTFEIKNKVIGD